MNQLSAAFLILLSAGPLWAAEPAAVEIGRRKQLLVDDFVIDKLTNVTRTLGTVGKVNGGKPIFTDGWLYGTVLHHDDRFKLWWRKPGTQGYGYAESRDGVRFEKVADLTGINFAGDYNLAVEFDPHETDPEHRFKAGYDAPGMAAGIAHSKDGIRWTPYNNGRPVTGRAADAYNQILWDDIAKTYRLFTRTDFGTPGGNTELRGTRSMTNPDPKRNPTDWKLVRDWKFDKEGTDEAQRRQIYSASCWIYERVYFALLTVYDFPGDFSEGRETDLVTRHEKDVLNFYIATSRDGVTWDFRWVYAGEPMIPRGPDGAFDKDLLLPASTIVTHDDTHWLYYAGGNERHGSEGTVTFDRQHAIGLATLPLDGFVALSAGKEPGTVVTKPLKWDGDKLLVNVDSEGSLTVEILDADGKPIPSFSGENAEYLGGINNVRHEPKWKGGKLSDLKGKVIRLKFTLQNTRLYAFQFQ